MDVPEDMIAAAIIEAFGERCPDFDADCFCCLAWKQYDELKAAPLAATERAAKIAEEWTPTGAGVSGFEASEIIAAAIRQP